jgi:hypothetical protein
MAYSIGLLERGARLRRRAVAAIVDVNEAYLIVHNVFARALGGVSAAPGDLDRALTSALALRATRVRPCMAPS